jgi:hypothetical protein
VTKPFHKQPASGDLVLPGVTLHLLEGVHQNVSATAIREAAALGKPLARWLDAQVAEYVKKVGLYRKVKGALEKSEVRLQKEVRASGSKAVNPKRFTSAI